MRIVTDEIREKYTKLLEEYIDKYGSLYDEEALEYIKRSFMDIDFAFDLDVDILSQVYQKIGVYDEYPDNKYTAFYNYMKERYDLNRNLLEVASGMYPSFAEKVARNQTHGSVTAMDPGTIVKEADGIKVIKRRFTRNTDLSKYDLIYAIRPCEAQEKIIRAANKNNIEFCTFSCGCTSHLPKRILNGRSNATYSEYLSYIKDVIERAIPSTLEYRIDYLSDYREPIISTKRLNLK